MPEKCPRPDYLALYERCHACPRWDLCQTEGWEGSMAEYYEDAGPSWEIRHQSTDGRTWWWFVYAVSSDGAPLFCPNYFLKRTDAQAWVDTHEIQLELP